MEQNNTMFRCNHHFRLYFLDILVFSHLRCIYPIHPAFRVVGLGEPVISAEGSSQPSWISPEVLTMFQFHHIPPLPIHQERHILENKVSQLSFSVTIRYACFEKVPYLPGSIMDSLLGFTHTLRTSSDPTVCFCLCYC